MDFDRPAFLSNRHLTLSQAPYCGASSLKADTAQQGDSWNNAKKEAETVSWLFGAHASSRVKRWGERIAECGHRVTFSFKKTDEGWRRKVSGAKLCRCRMCPICRWRRSLRLQHTLKARLEYLRKEKPGLAAVFLTLTVRNCDVSDLKETSRIMLKGWSKLTRRKSFRGVAGYLRTLEVTRGKDGPMRAHPHIHALLLVDPETFDVREWDNFAWADEWGSTMGLDYRPVVDIRPVTDMERAVIEVAKYLVKPGSDTMREGWLPEVALQLDGIRAMATGGIIRQVDDEEIEEDSEEAGTLVEALPWIPGRLPGKLRVVEMSYVWNPDKRLYLRAQVAFFVAPQ